MDLRRLAWLVCFSIYVRAADFGPYDLKNYNFQSCSEITKPKIAFHIKEKKLNRNTFAYDLNITNTIPFDDNLTAVINVAERTSRGRFKDNSFVRAIPKACTMFKTFIPGIFNILARELMKTTGENLATCHIPPGRRSFFNVIFDEKSKKIVMAAPAFWYKQYIMRVYMKRQSALISCLQYNLDVVPKKN